MIWTKAKKEGKNITTEEIIEGEEEVEATKVQEEEEISMEINKTITMDKINNKDQSINNNNSEKFTHYQFLLLKQWCHSHLHRFKSKLKNKSNCNFQIYKLQILISIKEMKEKTL